MKAPGNSDELERACNILEVPLDSSWETIEQAFHDLKEVWDPRRFQSDERLVRRAEEQRHRIAGAYLVLKRHHLPPDPLMGEWAGAAKPVCQQRTTDTSGRPSLLDDLFSEVSAKPAKNAGESAAEEAPRNPSLVHDVFAAHPKAARRFPVWLLVLAAIALTVFGSVVVYRSKPTPIVNLGEEKRPALEMAEPPPVPPLPGETTNPTDLIEAATPAAAGNETETQVGPAAKSSIEKQAPAPQSLKPVAASKPAGQTAPADTDVKPGGKPKLLREPEDLAKEQKAFDVLREKSQAARRLVDGNLEQYRFIEYQVIPKDAGQYWVHIVAELKGTGRAVGLIWSVDPDKQTTRPMSQAARDLDR